MRGSHASIATFSAHAAEYTAVRRRLVPVYDAFYGAVVDVLGLVEGGVDRVLDLGAGTGLLSEQILAALPEVRIELLDGSAPMVREAQERLGAAVEGVHVADMAGELPDGPFDAVVSALAIHHLEHADQRALMQRVRSVLRPGGIFVNAEQVAGSTPALTRAYEARWGEECWALGASSDELRDACDRMRHDRCADVESQLQWLREAGFAAADCVYRHWRFAVLTAFTEEPA